MPLTYKASRQPPPDTALITVCKGFLSEKLRSGTALNTIRFDKVMHIKMLDLVAITLKSLPTTRIEDQDDMGRISRLKLLHALVDQSCDFQGRRLRIA
jgi:hypothetical protein